ncbi:glutamine--tRNA ligase-like protein [Tanacetum coccineum]
MTLAGLRRRGVTYTAINTFVKGISINRSDCSLIRLEKLESHVRNELNITAPRTMVVLNPLKVVITNLSTSLEVNAKKWLDAPNEGASSPYKIGRFKRLQRACSWKDCPTQWVGVHHWVPGVDPLKVEVRLFNNLFKSENPRELENWLEDLNPESKAVIPCAYGVPYLEFAEVGDTFQFERHSYFLVDKDSTPEKLVFNRTVAMKDTYKPGSK